MDPEVMEAFFELKLQLKDVENMEDKIDDQKKNTTELWSQVNALKTDVSDHKVEMAKEFSDFKEAAKGQSTKMDVIWKILIAIATAAALGTFAL